MDEILEILSKDARVTPAEVARRLPGPRIDYVRLNIDARRAR